MPDSLLKPDAPNPKARLRLLIVDDDRDDIELCLRNLQKSDLDFEALVVNTREDFVRELRERDVDIVLSDYRMKGWTGMDAVSIVSEIRPHTPLILLSGTLGDELAVDCIKSGVTDYILKHQMARLPVAIRRAQEERVLRDAEVAAVRALRESEERYRVLVENAPEAIVVVDGTDGRFVDCNENALHLFGLSRTELLQRGPADLSPERQPDGELSAIAVRRNLGLAILGQSFVFEWTHRNARGEEIPCEIHLVLLPFESRSLIRGSIVDISKRKQAETALRESEARYHGLVNNSIYGIYWVSHEGNLLDANPALASMLGYDSVADFLAIGDSHALYINPADREKVHGEYLLAGRVHATVGWKRKDSKPITVRLNGWQGAGAEAGEPYVEVIVEDVTEHIALEKQLVQAQKFEAIGQLAGGIAHDFNNMIGAIIGWADMGLEETHAAPRLRRYFEKVRQQADRAAALTRQLLAFARRQILEPRNVDMNQAVIETISLLEKVIGGNIAIKANLAPDLSVVRADPVQVEQVLMNLCINARDAMPDGGALTVDTSNVTIDEEFCILQPLAHPGQYIMLAVTDTGTGMDTATLDRIFEPFFTTKEMGKGTGLGLATVYGIIRQHGGFLHVISQPGAGSTFRVYLPVSTVSEARAALADNNKPMDGGSETLLVAEDHEGLRQLAYETLVNLGYTVLLAANGEEAVAQFGAHREEIDLALLDVVLPKLSGPEVYARISEGKPDLPIVFATGYSPDLALLQKVQQKGLPVLQKPYSPRDLAHKVREALDRRHRLIPHK
ncbi:MAG TPA: response regulator [Candidatus Acidoferrales bacterium]|jgi:PAS domain S-box-containing protein|nr:response regulator [Candidatus Acidoferrales bacterium]